MHGHQCHRQACWERWNVSDYLEHRREGVLEGIRRFKTTRRFGPTIRGQVNLYVVRKHNEEVDVVNIHRVQCRRPDRRHLQQPGVLDQRGSAGRCLAGDGRSVRDPDPCGTPDQAAIA